MAYLRPTGPTALIWAAQYGDLAEVEWQLAHGANVKVRDQWGRTALIAAACRGSAAVVRVLLDHGADPNASNDKGMTPLIEAALGGCTEVIELLIASSGDVNQKNKAGVSALSIGIARGDAWVRPFLTRPHRKQIDKKVRRNR